MADVIETVPRRLLIGGEWVDATGRATFEVTNPATGEALTSIADATPADGTRALDAAVAAQKEWAATEPRARGEILRRAFELLTERADDFARLLPDGLASPGMHLWTARAGGSDEPVGIGWIEVRERPSGTSALVFDVEVEEQHRGRGLGRALMEALHDAARELGATSISLNVFGQNTTAIRLYDSLGYAVTSQQMKRDL